MILADLSTLHKPHQWQAEIQRLREENDKLKARVADLEKLVNEAFFEGFDDALGDSQHGYGREYYWRGSMAKEALNRGET